MLAEGNRMQNVEALSFCWVFRVIRMLLEAVFRSKLQFGLFYSKVKKRSGAPFEVYSQVAGPN